MFPTSLLGIVVLLIAIFVAFKLIKSIVKIGIIVVLFLLGSYLLFGGIPFIGDGDMDTDTLPIPDDSRVKDIIVTAKNIAWGVEVVSTAWDSDDTLLIAVTNTGQLPLSDIQVWVNDDEVQITNTAPESLEKGDTVILDTNYMAKGPMTIRVQAGRAEDEITANP